MKNILSFILILTALISVAGIGTQAEWLSLGTAAVDEMFTERDFDPSFESFSEIILADGASHSDSAAVSVVGDSVQIRQEGVYRLSGTLSNGQVAIYAPDNAKVQLVLDGVSLCSQGSAAIYAVNADKVFITAAGGSENMLRSLGELDDEDIDGAVYADTDICFNGEGSLIVESESGHGIVTKDDLKICAGSYSISAAKHGLSGKDSIRIGGGRIDIVSGSDGLHSNHDDADKGFIFISGGEVDIDCSKDGIDCTNYMNMLDGTVSINAGSDGINAAGENDLDSSCYVAVSGGELNITALEDGIDSNGSIGISGGEVYISAAPNGGDGALDYGTTAEITGGTVIAASAREMAANFSAADNQGSILCAFAQAHSAGEAAVLSAGGSKILSFTPELDYQAVVISCAGISADGIYTVSAGDESIELAMDGLLFSNGFGRMGQPGMMQQPMPHMGNMPEFMPPMGEMPGGTAPQAPGMDADSFGRGQFPPTV